MGKTTFIYALCEPNSRTVRYIGKTAKTPQKRLARHLRESVKCNSHLGSWLRKVVSCGTIPNLILLREVPGDGSEAEKRYIRLARGCQMKLVNGTEGGEGGVPTPETLAKRSASLRGENNPMFGRRHSQETKALLSAQNMGDKNPHFGKPSSLTTRTRISLKLKGRGKTPEHNAKNSAAQKLAWARRKAAQV